jgi:hypothetical protein
MGTRGCGTCKRLRLFFCVALPLVAMIYLQPEGAVRLAARLPTAEGIGWGIAIACVLVFGVRLWVSQRDAAH